MLFIICLLLSTFTFLSNCTPPEDPIKCKFGTKICTITNTYGAFPDRTICMAAQVAYPETESELISLVAMATKNKRKMKVATRFGHSIPKLVCPDGEDGLLISTKHLNRVMEIDKLTMRMRVESGVLLQDIITDAAEAGLALPYAPYFWGVTIGGMISTGAHGSSLVGQSAVHDHVVEIRIVSPGPSEEGYARVRVVNASDPDFDAVKVSLGVLGVISQVILQLEPIFKRSITYKVDDDATLVDEVIDFGNKHEFADISWFPSQKKVIYRIDHRVPTNASGNGLNDFTGFRSTPTLTLEFLRITEETQELTRDATGKCVEAKLITLTLQSTAFGLTNNGLLFTGYPVIGYQNRLQSAGGCINGRSSNSGVVLESCPWDPRVKGLFYHNTAFSIALSKVKGFIQDVQKLVKMEPKSLCGLESNNGILMRYVKASSAYIGKQEDSVDFDLTYYRSKDPSVPRLYEDILEEIEQIGILKYRGLPHWGKNRNVAFKGVINKYEKANDFLRVKNGYDPWGVFSNDWTNRILGVENQGDGNEGVMIVKEGCGLEGLCLCSEDSHCAPSRGYYCRPGRIYEDARVCTARLT